MKQKLTVSCEGKPCYDIVLTIGFEELAGAALSVSAPERKICIVTDTNVALLYAAQVKEAFSSAFAQVEVFEFPAGEENKTLANIQTLYAFLIEHHFDRKISILRHQLRKTLRQPGDELGFGHAFCLSALLVEFGLQQGAQVGRTGSGGSRFRSQLLHRFVLLGIVLGLDRQVDTTGLAIDVDDHRLDFITDLQVLRQVVDTIAGELGSTQVAFVLAIQGHHGTTGIHRLDGSAHDAVLLVGSDEVGVRVTFHLLDTEGDTLLLDVDAEHDGFDFVTLLEVADGFFAGCRPGQVGQVNQTIDTTGQADEDAEVGDRLDGTTDLVALLVVHREVIPRIRLALLHAEGDTTTLFVDF